MPGIFDLLHNGWNLLTKNIRVYQYYLIVFFVLSMITNIFGTFYGPTEGTILAQNWNELLSYGLVALPLALALFYVTLALMRAMYRRLHKESVTHTKNLTVTGQRLISSVVAYVLTVAIISAGGLLLFYAGFMTAGGALFVGVENLPTSLWIQVALSFLLVIVGMAALVWFIFAYLEVLFENKGPIKALKASYRLVKGRWWLIFWLTTATSLILSALGYLISSVGDSLITVLLLQSTLGASSPTPLLSSVTISTLTALLITPWGYCVSLYIYDAAKKTRS